MRRLPKLLRILSHRVPVVLVDGLVHDEEDKTFACHGLYNVGQFIIELEAADGPERRKVTLMHEALHALIGVAHVPEAADEEAAVTVLAPLLLHFIRENKAAVAYMQES